MFASIGPADSDPQRQRETELAFESIPPAKMAGMVKHSTRSKRKGRAPRRSKPRRDQTRFITRALARRQAERHVLKRMFRGAPVRDGAEVRLGIYARGNWTAKDVRVVYKNPEEIALKSAEVVVVSKRTGRVVYEGPAGDEGQTRAARFFVSIISRAAPPW